jgi:CelD/BcsL family acetyltransferase involved in cellulose biosynthesis
VKVQLHTAPDVFIQLADEWDTLVDTHDATLFFLHSDWQRLWWKHLGHGDLTVWTVRDEDQSLVGIAPLFIDKQNGKLIASMVGCKEVTDYVNLVYPDNEQANDVLDALLKQICASDSPRWDEWQLCNIPAASKTLTLLPEIAHRYGLKVEQQVADVCPIIALPPDYEAYLTNLDKKQRHELRRKRRRAEAHPVEWHRTEAGSDFNFEIERFLDLMRLSTTDKARFLTETGHIDFFRDMGDVFSKKGCLELSFLSVDGHPAAALWYFIYKERIMLYNSGLNPADFAGLSPGIVLLTMSIEDAIQRKFTLYDFLRGDEEYKFRMGATSTSVYSLTLRRG